MREQSKLVNTRLGERPDPIRFEVIRNGLTAAADEMGVALQRAAYSTNVKTRLDFSCAIFDAHPRMIAQSFSIPIHLGSLTHFVPRLVGALPADLSPGDILISNDGHRGGVHLNDVCVVAPVFVDGTVVAFVATLAHHVDVGGGTPGSMGLTREIFQEGVNIPPSHLVRAGRMQDEFLGLILNNVRSPKETAGDLRAQIAGANIGVRRLEGMIEKFGLETWRQNVEQLLVYTERRARAAIVEIPKGEYFAEGYMDSDGFSDDPVRIVVRIKVSDEEVTYDLTGSDPQCHGPINATYAMTLSNCAYSLRALIDPDLPTNDGFYRILNVIAPPGSVVNALPPAAISCGWETGFRVCETAFQALAQAVPTRTTAGSKGCLCNIMFGGIDPRTGRYFAFFDSLAGGYGARATKDGIDAIQPHVQNSENAPIEETEANYPVQIVRYELIPDSDGAGRQRGGLGLRRDYSFEGEVVFSVIADKSKFEPFGLAGGHPARGSHFVRNPDQNAEIYPSKFSITLAPGEVFSVQMGGGGGFGPPGVRDPQLILDDIANGKLSPDRARTAYGFVDSSNDELPGETNPKSVELRAEAER